MPANGDTISQTIRVSWGSTTRARHGGDVADESTGQDEPANELAALLSPYWTAAHTQQTLGIPTQQALNALLHDGTILGVTSDTGDVFYPVCQFHKQDDGTVVVSPALAPVFRALRDYDSWAVGVFLHTSAPELDGLTPLQWVQEGRSSTVLADLVHAVEREWAAGHLTGQH